MIGHNSPISGVACLRDEYVATAGYDNQVILWDAATGSALTRVLHDHLANQCAFSPDGSWLVTSSSDYTARLWSVPDLRLRAVLDGHEDDVEMSVFHPTQSLIATACRDHRLRVFDFTGARRAEFVGHQADINTVQWSQDGEQLISASDDCTIKRWSLASGELLDDLDMGGVETDTVVLTGDGTVYAANDEGEIITIYPDGSRSLVPAHRAGVKRLVHDNSLELLVSLSYDRTAKLWSTGWDGLSLVAETDIPTEVWPRSCAFGGEGILVFGTFGRTYRTFNYLTRRWGPSAPETHGLNAVVAHGGTGVAYAIGDSGAVWREDDSGGRTEVARTGSLCNFLIPAGDLLLTGGQLGVVFDAYTGRALHQHRSPLNCGVRFTRDGQEHVVVGSYTGEGLLFRVDGDQVTHLRDLPLLPNAVKGVAIDDRQLLAVCADCTATWWDIDTLEHEWTVSGAHDRIINGCVALSGGRFATIGRDLKLRLWGPGEKVEVVATPHANSIKCTAASSDGRLIATGGYRGMVAVFDVEERSWVQVVRPTMGGISSLSYDKENKTFLASSYDGGIHRVRC